MTTQKSVYNSWQRYKVAFFAILLLFIINACKTLTSKSIAVDLPCHECQAALKDSLLATEGVYYTTYNTETGELTYKYDSAEINDEQLHYLLYQWSASQKDSSGVLTCCPNNY